MFGSRYPFVSRAQTSPSPDATAADSNADAGLGIVDVPALEMSADRAGDDAEAVRLIETPRLQLGDAGATGLVLPATD